MFWLSGLRALFELLVCGEVRALVRRLSEGGEGYPAVERGNTLLAHDGVHRVCGVTVRGTSSGSVREWLCACNLTLTTSMGHTAATASLMPTPKLARNVAEDGVIELERVFL